MKRVISVFLLLLTLFSTLTAPVYADATSQQLDEYQKCLDEYRDTGDLSSCIHVKNVTDLNFLAIADNIIPIGTQKQTLLPELYRGSVIGKIGSGIAYMYLNKPADSRQYLAYYSQKLGIAPAYAQVGIGFSALSPLLRLWKAFANIAYGFLIIIMVFIGFMILFRMKIDPRTVISVQNAIPRILVTFGLIFFSYAIVALLIDVMYLLIFLFVAAIGSTIKLDPSVYSVFTGGSTSGLFSATFTTGMGAVDELTKTLGGGWGTAVTYGVLVGLSFFPILLFATVPTAIGGLVTGGNPLVVLIVALALLFVFIRILYTLINAYIQIIISLIFGPLLLMVGAIPNVNAFGSWFRGLIANIAVFPVTMGVMLVAQVLSSLASESSNLWKPPGLAGSFGGAIGSGMSGIIGLGMLFMIPTIVGSIKDALKVKPVIPAGLGSLISPIAAPLGTLWQYGYQFAHIRTLFQKPGGPGKEGKQ